MEPDHELGRVLSLRSIISSTPSFDEEISAAETRSDTYRLIGYGACGAIYGQYGVTSVLKLAKTDDPQLWNDYMMHTRVWEALKITDFQEVRVPQPKFYVPKDQEHWWAKNKPLFPAKVCATHLPTAVLATEKILPLPSAIRTLLIQRFCPPHIQQAAFASPGNRDCLVRIYLGSTCQANPDGAFFSLRNFKLHLNNMLDLDMDVFHLAHRMAVALAVMHWAARIDARDVEFVIGGATPPSTTTTFLTSQELESLAPDTYTEPLIAWKAIRAAHSLQLWVLDFNQCSEMTRDDEGIVKAVEAYRINDPYYPRPVPAEGELEGALWRAFAGRYVQVSDGILPETPHGRALPRRFVRAVEVDHEEKVKRQAVAAAASASGP